MTRRSFRLFQAVLTLFLASPARPQMTAPPAPPDIAGLRDAFVETLEDQQKAEILQSIARTPAVTSNDVQALYDLFMRFSDNAVRESVLRSLDLASPHSPHLEPVFLRYMEEPEPESVLFGIKGALRIRAAGALPLIRKIARRSFAFKSPQDTPLLSEKNAWWTQYEALSALAQWEGPKTVSLLMSRASEAPAVARIMALFVWKESLPQFVKWSESHGADNQERAKQALSAPVPAKALRETRPEMMRILRDPKADKELRHQIALKVGFSSSEEGIGELLKEYEALKEPETKLMFSAALFASRSRQVVPLLTQHAKEHPDPRIRAGARVQLKDMLPAAEYRALVEWASKNDPDPDNKRDAAEELKPFP